MRAGPGKYETNTSRISEASGHNSSFRPPTERPKLKNRYGSGGEPEVPTRGRKSKGAKGAAKATAKTD